MENQNPPTINPSQAPSPVQNPSQTPPSTPEIVKKTSKFSIKAIISTIIFLLFAGGIALALAYRGPIMNLVSAPTPTVAISPSPTPDPTANWKKYRNTTVGFEFKYPPKYDPIYPKEGGLGSSVRADGSEDNKTIDFSPGSEGFLLSIFTYPGTLDALTKLQSYAGYSDFSKPTKLIKNFNVDGKDSIWYITTSSIPSKEGDESSLKIFFLGNYHAFVLKTSLDHDQKELDQILSTFKFFDIQTIETTNWNTYKDTILGIQFNYPSDFEIVENQGSVKLSKYYNDVISCWDCSNLVEIEVVAKSNNQNQDDLETLAFNYAKSKYNLDTNPSAIETKMIGGIKTLKDYPGLSGHDYYFLIGDTFIALSSSVAHPNIIDPTEKIISSFKKI